MEVNRQPPVESGVDPTGQTSAVMTPDPAQLWDEFMGEFWEDQCWDHDFIGSPHHPSEPLRALVDQAGAMAVPFLVEALSSKDDSLVYWACVGLRWLGPLAGEDAVVALEARIGANKQPSWPEAVALEAIDPVRARAVGSQHDPSVMSHLVRFYLEQSIETACDFFERVIDKEDEKTIEAMLSSWQLRDAVIQQCPVRLAVRFEQLANTHPSEGVRKVAGRLLGEARINESAAILIDTLVRTGGISTAAVERLASHPDSVLLVKPLADLGNVNLLADLLLRRRCAGWRTDPDPARPLLREKLERPIREWRYEEHEVHYAALCVAELGDVALIDSLLKAVIPENGGFAWLPLVRALWSLGSPAIEALRQELAGCPPGERRKRLEWMLDAVERRKGSLQESLAGADATFLRGRIEPSVYGAFRAYADVLLLAPSAHAAFQLAWIDRAFGSEIVPERVQWIRELGFRDEELLGELATPLANPLHGLRFLWDGGETTNDASRAAPALAAGLPSLAAHWSRGAEAYQRAAATHLERVRRATTA